MRLWMQSNIQIQEEWTSVGVSCDIEISIHCLLLSFRFSKDSPFFRYCILSRQWSDDERERVRYNTVKVVQVGVSIMMSRNEEGKRERKRLHTHIPNSIGNPFDGSARCCFSEWGEDRGEWFKYLSRVFPSVIQFRFWDLEQEREHLLSFLAVEFPVFSTLDIARAGDGMERQEERREKQRYWVFRNFPSRNIYEVKRDVLSTYKPSKQSALWIVLWKKAIIPHDDLWYEQIAGINWSDNRKALRRKEKRNVTSIFF